MASIKPKQKDPVQGAIADFINPPVKNYTAKQRLALEQVLCYKLNDWCVTKGYFCFEGNQRLAANGAPALLIIKKLGSILQGVAVYVKAPGCVEQSSVQQEASIRKLHNNKFVTVVVDELEQAKREIDYLINDFK